jgi:hypothetical protein
LAQDEGTKKRTFDHFARILIDVDLNSNLRERILVERNDFYFMLMSSMRIFLHLVIHVRLFGILLRIASIRFTQNPESLVHKKKSAAC